MKIRVSILKKTIVLIGILTLFIFGFVFFLSNNSSEFNSEVRAAIRDEFKGVYLEDFQSSGEVIEYDLVAIESEIEIFDGYKTKVWAYNEMVPGPEIRIKVGDTLKVNFTNNLDQETTIHWHGVRVPNNMDGVPSLNQEPIQPGEIFVYEFTPKDAGTFWFHPHVRGSEQVEKGLFGTLIVEDDYGKYDQDIVWVIDDWKLMDDYQINPNFVTNHDLMHDGRWGNVITVNSKLNEVINVNPGERIRLRFVNSSNARVYAPHFGDLNAKVIAVDGLYVKEVFSANGFELSPGNRIDIDIQFPEDLSEQNIEIVDYFSRYPNKLGTILVGKETKKLPEFEYPVNNKIPDWGDFTEVKIDKTYVLDAQRNMGIGMMAGIEWTINGQSYPNYDPLELNYNEFNKIKFQNDSYRLHPMHLHGQFFKVLSRNGKTVNEPYFRDTVLVHSKESIEIGIVPLDKGEWANHCHILEHADAGMMTIISVK